jgi:replicative DNA helicase
VTEEFDRVMPHDTAAEQAVIGGIMLSQTAADEVFDFLTPADFYRPNHAKIFAAVMSLWAGEQPTDPVAVAHLLDVEGDLQRVGGFDYLHTCIASVPTAANASYYGRIVAEKAALRRLIEAGTKVAQLGYASGGLDVEALSDQAQRIVHQATVRNDAAEDGHLGAFIDSEMNHLEAVTEGLVPKGISTGLGQLDKLLGGFLPGQLIIPAGRPGMGKSLCAVGFAKAAARRGIPAMIFSVEMSKRELVWRLLSDIAEINLTQFTAGRLTRDELDRARKASKVIAEWPLHIYDTCRTVASIRSTARRFRQRNGRLGIVAVDYLQRLTSTVKHDRRDLEVGSFARELKTLAQELEATVVAPCQINRESQGRTSRIPQLSDLRDSGELEQEADVVILIHREDYYDPEHARAGEADFIVAKHRNGPTDTVTVAGQLHFSRFTDWTDSEI